MHLSRYIDHWASERGDEYALICGDERLTWRELNVRADRLAAELAYLGLRPGDRFGCLLQNCIEWCVGFVAAVKVGAIFVPLNPAFGPFELQSIARDAECFLTMSIGAMYSKIDADAAANSDSSDCICLFRR